MSAFAELHAKTCFSFLEGASHPREMVEQAHELGLQALAITDLHSISGMVEAFAHAKTLKKEHGHAPKLIVGAEFLLENQHPLVLLAQTQAGHRSLCRLISKAQMGTPPKLALDQLAMHTQDLLPIADTQDIPTLSTLKDLFGKALSLEISRDWRPGWQGRDAEILQASEKLSIPLLASSNALYHHTSRKHLQDVLRCIRLGCSLEEAGQRLNPNAERCLKSPATMAQIFQDLPHALSRSVDLADACDFSLFELRYHYPKEWLPDGQTAFTHLKNLTLKGAKKRFPQGVPSTVQRQIQHELKLIQDLSYEDYFLTIWDICTFARSQDILCQGRGSAANSVVCYCLEITAIDPVRQDLLFERFISKERKQPPDIDVDFEHERREEVIQYIYRRYGRHRAAITATTIRYRTRSALADVAKAYGASHQEAMAMSKSYQRRDAKHVNRTQLNAHLPRVLQDKVLLKSYMQTVEHLKGFPRHLGTHVGGFVLTDCPLTDMIPIQKASMEGRTIIQWNKDDLDAMGIMKVDILGLGMLSCIRACFDWIEKLHPDQPRPTLATLPAEDPSTYQMIQNADTVGVFQIESRAQMSMLPRLKPKNFSDLVVEVAIVRPGPIQGKMIHPYLKRRQGLEKPYYAHPALKRILGKTFGVLLFQEQVMQVAMAVAGFDAGEADQLRRAMGIWRTSHSVPLERMKRRMIQGMQKEGLSQADAEDIFRQVASFGEFGFPESHSASFALLVYASAYLKCHHPVEFTCALMNSQPMGFYSMHTLIDDLRKHKHPILPIDVTQASWFSSIETDAPSTQGHSKALRLGFHLIRGLRLSEIEKLLATRDIQPFVSLEDFLHRTELSTSTLFALAKANAFACFGHERRDALWHVQSFSLNRPDLFPWHSGAEQKANLAPHSDMEKVFWDYQSFGATESRHPMEFLRQEVTRLGGISASKLATMPKGASVSLGGMVIVKQSPPTAKGMVFITMEDEDGFINGVLDPKTYARFHAILKNSGFLFISGILQRDQKALSIKIRRIRPLTFADKTFKATRIRAFH